MVIRKILGASHQDPEVKCPGKSAWMPMLLAEAMNG